MTPGQASSRFRLILDIAVDLRRIAPRLWQLAVVWHEELVFFAGDASQMAIVSDGLVRRFNRYAPVPSEIRNEFLRLRGGALWTAMWLRLRVQRVELLVILQEGRIAAYCWLRTCDGVPLRYRWLARRGTLLGYFWTEPDERGRGLYGVLLRASVALSAARCDDPVIVYADTWNVGSIRGLEKAGFCRLGTYAVTSRLFGLITTHITLEERRTLAQLRGE